MAAALGPGTFYSYVLAMILIVTHVILVKEKDFLKVVRKRTSIFSLSGKAYDGLSMVLSCLTYILFNQNLMCLFCGDFPNVLVLS